MFTVNMQSTTVSGITLSMSFSANNEKELMSKVQESVEIVHKPDPRQMILGDVPVGSTKDANATTKMAIAIDEISKVVGGAEKMLDAAFTSAPKESSIDGVAVSDLDKDGRVWDERIDSPLKVKDRWGRWKQKLNVNKTDRIRIIEEMKNDAIEFKNVKPESTPVPANDTAIETNQVETPAVPTTEAPAEVAPVEHMTLEHFGNNFPTVMGVLFNNKKITAEKVQQLCEIARVKQAYEIPLNEISLKAVYNTLVTENLI